MSPDIDARDPLHRVPPGRTTRPLYVDRLPPSSNPCPAGENVQAWLAGQPSHGLPTIAHAPVGKGERRLVSRIFLSWNQLEGWLRQIEGLRAVA